MTRHPTIAIRFASVTLLCTVAVAGCSDDDDDDPAPAAAPDGTSMPAPGVTPGAPAPTTLNGEWLLACSESEPDVPEEGYDVTTLTIAGDTGTSRILQYTDSACTVPGSPAEIVVTVSIAYPGGSTDTERGPALHVDVTPESVLVDGAMPPVIGTPGDDTLDTDYDIALVTGNELYFGDFEIDPDRDGESAERRPETLEATPFVRQ